MIKLITFHLEHTLQNNFKPEPERQLPLTALAQHAALFWENVIRRKRLIGLFKKSQVSEMPFPPTAETLGEQGERRKSPSCLVAIKHMQWCVCVYNCGPSSALRSVPNQRLYSLRSGAAWWFFCHIFVWWMPRRPTSSLNMRSEMSWNAGLN